MKRILAIIALATAVAISSGLVYAHKPNVVDDSTKITLCHRTDSTSNPYVEITVDQNALHGHDNHTGPVASSQAIAVSLKLDHKKWGDIIPDVLNWTDEGQAIVKNHCQFVVTETPVTPPSPSPSPSPAPVPVVSPTPVAPDVTIKVDVPEVPGFQGK